ncbi:MAG: polyphosphate polymerase domain-containing protein [Gammaproteobacteria bacterium]|nr:polyphosphate polymerase domain-containing protein [Gammaproteobacteria bacterium]
MSAVLSNLPPVLERHELKYLVPYELVEPITRFISPYCSLDHYSSLAEDHFYVVNSLYFDTRGLELLQQRMNGKDSRFNMRVRAYADGDKAPYFMEIKHKIGSIVKKYRATATDKQWPQILQDPCYRIDPNEFKMERRNKELFLRLVHSYALEPKILTQYRRRAFFSTVDNYARVTLDIDMKYRNESMLTLVPGNDMLNYDNENIYTTNQFNQNLTNVVLELKCNIGEVPMWMLDLITRFELKQTGFSKYMSSMLVSHFDNGYNYMVGDRMGY